jgi:hypothetical protein
MQVVFSPDGKTLGSVPVTGPRQIARLIASLDNDQFAVREEATAELERLAEAALPAVRKAGAESPSAEVRRRAERLLQKWNDPEPPPSAFRWCVRWRSWSRSARRQRGPCSRRWPRERRARG